MGTPQRGYRIEVKPFQYVFVFFAGLRWHCSCSDFLFNSKRYTFLCSHILRVQQMLGREAKEVA
jgi:hypothetical protein